MTKTELAQDNSAGLLSPQFSGISEQCHSIMGKPKNAKKAIAQCVRRCACNWRDT